MTSTAEQKQCLKCQAIFSVSAEDRVFYDEVSPVFQGQKYLIPSPSLCPSCRLQRRLSWRNERSLYWRKCDATGKDLLSVFHPDAPYKVYDVDFWHGDGWDARQYARDFDFSRPFFDQFHDLMIDVPQMARSATGNQNCQYSNQIGWCKNCYLLFEGAYNEDCMYVNYVTRCKNTVDVFHCVDSELCYEAVSCYSCYELRYSDDCRNCSESWFLKDCIGCTNCVACYGLRNKKYCIYNEQYSADEYQAKLQAMSLHSYQNVQALKRQFEDWVKQFPHRYMHGIQNENSTGDYINNTQNCQQCFDVFQSQDCKYCFEIYDAKNNYDVSVWGKMEFCLECHEIGDNSRNLAFCDQLWNGAYNIFYSKLCLNNCHDLFGCMGLKNASYSILNKQYDQDTYEQIMVRIIEHMRETGEWGEFFAPSISPFTYNETIAQEHFPLSSELAHSQGFRWRDEDKKVSQEQVYTIPDSIEDVTADICQEMLQCITTGKNFKILQQELDFYKKLGVPIPRKCFDQRHAERFVKRNPARLWSRNCQSCQKEMQTSFSPHRPEKVYCEECYLKMVY